MSIMGVSFWVCSLLGSVSSTSLFPYGPEVDSELSDDSELVHLKSPLLFLGSYQHSLLIQNNGIISLNNNVTIATIAEPLPINGSSFIAPFWFDSTPEAVPGHVYYRHTQDTTVRAEVTALIKDIEEYWQQDEEYTVNLGTALDSSSLNMIIITWGNVTYITGNTQTEPNTFQCVLAFTTNASYVIFLYEKVEINQDTNAVQAGMNHIDGYMYVTLPLYSDDDTAGLMTSSNSDIPGVWMFPVHEPKWTTVSKCIYCSQNCPPIETPLNGSLTLDVNNPGPGRRVTYTCDKGFRISGNHGYDKRTCLSNGEWTGTSIMCGLIKDDIPLYWLWFLLPLTLVVCNIIVIVYYFRKHGSGLRTSGYINNHTGRSHGDYDNYSYEKTLPAYTDSTGHGIGDAPQFYQTTIPSSTSRQYHSSRHQVFTNSTMTANSNSIRTVDARREDTYRTGHGSRTGAVPSRLYSNLPASNNTGRTFNTMSTPWNVYDQFHQCDDD